MDSGISFLIFLLPATVTEYGREGEKKKIEFRSRHSSEGFSGGRAC